MAQVDESIEVDQGFKMDHDHEHCDPMSKLVCEISQITSPAFLRQQEMYDKVDVQYEMKWVRAIHAYNEQIMNLEKEADEENMTENVFKNRVYMAFSEIFEGMVKELKLLLRILKPSEKIVTMKMVVSALNDRMSELKAAATLVSLSEV